MAFDEAKVKLIIEASTEAAARKMREFSDTAAQSFQRTGEAAKRYTSEQLSLQKDVTDKYMKLSLSKRDYAIWALNQETAAMKEKANNEKAILDQINKYHEAASKEIVRQCEDQSNALQKIWAKAKAGWVEINAIILAP